MGTHIMVHIKMGLCPFLYPWYVIIIPMYNAQTYFSLKNLDKNLHIIHNKMQYVLEAALIFGDTIDQSLIFTFLGSKSQIWQGSRKLVYYSSIHDVLIFNDICMCLEIWASCL